MAECNAKTKDGTPCQVPTREGQKYCHIHRRQRRWHQILSASVIAAVGLGVLGFIANLTSVLGYFGIPPPFAIQKTPVASSPYEQMIRTATATVEVIILSDENVNTTYLDSGGYIAFGKGNEPLLIMSSTQSAARQTGDGRVAYRAVFSLDVENIPVGKTISFLKEAEYIQVYFVQMPKQSKVLTGKATCIFNSAVLTDIAIPAQTTSEGLVFNRNLDNLRLEFSR